MAIVVGAGFVAAPFRNGFCPFHHKRTAFLADISRRLGFHNVFTVRIFRTAVKYSISAALFGKKAFFANRADDIGFFSFFGGGILFDIAAFRVSVAGNEFSEFAFAFNKFAFQAFGAGFSGFFGRFHRFSVNGAGAGAVGESRTAQKFSVAAKLNDHTAAAFRADDAFIRFPQSGYFFGAAFFFNLF